jgi:group I intron endonuclease
MVICDEIINIYVVINKVNGKLYFGQTQQTLSDRWSGGHVAEANRGSPRALPRAIRKYGASSFEVVLVDVCYSRGEANHVESLLIDHWRTQNPRVGYNMREGGSMGRHSAESRRKMSLSHKGKKIRPESIEKTRRANIGRKNTPETLERMSQAAKRRGVPEATLRKFVAAGRRPGIENGKAKFRSMDDVREARAKYVSGELSVGQLSELYGIKYQTMRRALANETYTDPAFVPLRYYELLKQGKRKPRKSSRPPWRKVQIEDARQIRALRAAGWSNKRLALRYGVTADYISRVVYDHIPHLHDPAYTPPVPKSGRPLQKQLARG